MSALLLVDIQYDFLDQPSPGALAISGGHEILRPVYRLLDEGDWDIVVASQDYHPPYHISFASRHPGHDPFTTIEVDRPPRHDQHRQELWPDHCVQGTKGCEIEHGVMERLERLNGEVVQKGTDKDLDAYSAFAIPLTAEDQHVSPVTKALSDANVTTLVVVGLATDYCVRASVLAALEVGRWNVLVVRECVRGVDPAQSEQVLLELEGKGAHVIGIDDAELKGVWKQR